MARILAWNYVEDHSDFYSPYCVTVLDLALSYSWPNWHRCVLWICSWTVFSKDSKIFVLFTWTVQKWLQIPKGGLIWGTKGVETDIRNNSGLSAEVFHTRMALICMAFIAEYCMLL